MTSRENFLRLYNHEPASYVPSDGPYDGIPVPGERGESMELGSVGTDWFRVSWTCCNAVGGVAPTPTPGVFAINDISEWKEKGVIPSMEKIENFDWEGYCNKFTSGWDRDNHISICFAPSGFFERLHHLMPFEDALCAFYEDPDSLHEFFDALLDYKKIVYKKIKDYANPDVILFFDDYGASEKLFMSRELWLEFIAPRLKELIRYCKEIGYLFEMHSCGYITPLVGDMVDMGIDAMQPLQAQNDLRMIKEKYGNRLLIHGGIKASDLENEFISHEDLVAKVKECVEICAPNGGFVVLLSECDHRRQEVSDAFKAELNKIGFKYY